MDAVHWASMAVLLYQMILSGLLYATMRRYKNAMAEWQKYKSARENLLKKMANPGPFLGASGQELTEDEFSERTADIIEARNANRLAKPRDVGQPHAVVHRPKAMRNKLPTRWNPPSDYNQRMRASDFGKGSEEA